MLVIAIDGAMSKLVSRQNGSNILLLFFYISEKYFICIWVYSCCDALTNILSGRSQRRGIKAGPLDCKHESEASIFSRRRGAKEARYARYASLNTDFISYSSHCSLVHCIGSICIALFKNVSCMSIVTQKLEITVQPKFILCILLSESLAQQTSRWGILIRTISLLLSIILEIGVVLMVSHGHVRYGFWIRARWNIYA